MGNKVKSACDIKDGSIVLVGSGEDQYGIFGCYITKVEHPNGDLEMVHNYCAFDADDVAQWFFDADDKVTVCWSQKEIVKEWMQCPHITEYGPRIKTLLINLRDDIITPLINGELPIKRELHWYEENTARELIALLSAFLDR